MLPWIHMHDYTMMLFEDKLRDAQQAHDRFDPLWARLRCWTAPQRYYRGRAALVGALGALLRTVWQ